MRSTLSSAITWCLETRDNDTLEELADMLESSPRVFASEQCQKLLDLVKSSWGMEQLNEVLRTGEIGDEKVVLLLTTYGTEKMTDLLDNDCRNECRG